MADKPVKELPLREVKLYQLPKWLSSLNFRPSGVGASFWRGVDRYNTKYVNVVKGNATPIVPCMCSHLVSQLCVEVQNRKASSSPQTPLVTMA